MLTRICLIMAILAGLAVAGINFAKIKPTIADLRTNLASETSAKDDALGQLATTRKELDTTKKERDEAKGEIASANDERDKAVASAETEKKRADQLTGDLTKSRQDLSDSQAELSQWSALGMKPEQIKALQDDLKQAQATVGSLNATNKRYAVQIKSLRNKLDSLIGDENPVILPADLQGRVLVSDPKWDFVVLNVGENQGVLENGILLVNRDGKLVAKVKVRSVQADRSIANVLPDWKLGEVMEGDQVIP